MDRRGHQSRRNGTAAVPYVVALAIVLLAMRAFASPGVSVPDGRGKIVTLRALPQRIVSLTPSNTEILFALGLKGRIVADTSQCNYPPEARSLPHIGDYRISVEKVVAQRPDLVIGITSMNRSAIEQLERLRIPVFAVDPANLTQTYDAIMSIGRITGKEPQAQAIVRSMRMRADAVQRRLYRERGQRPKVLIVIQAQPLMVAAGGNFLDELVTLAGGENVARDAGAGFPIYSPEKVVIHKPDVILAGPQSAEILKRRAGWSDVPAVKNNTFYEPPADQFVRPGPRLVEALEYLARKLHPGAFK